MRTTSLLAALAGVMLTLSFAGCGKQTASKPKTLQEGLAQMQASLVTASPAAQSNFYNQVQAGVRYDNLAQSLNGLEAIAADPGLSEQQKKLANDVIELLKAKMQGSGK
jgi:hypothetical protein